ncbi:MAG: hypothetical protein MRZ61_00030 [Oscillospiraceae bacterium]|nr:hypothetical protein [Oscillospiraceae bacterium]
MTPRQFAAECRACNPFTDPETAAVYLKAAADSYEGVIEQAKAACEQKYRSTLDQYAEKVEQLKDRISDLEDELEEKRIELAQLGGLDLLIGRLKATAERLEAVQVKADKPAAAQKKPCAKPAAPKGKTAEKYFEDFWAEYPKKRSKQVALKAWTRLAPNKELYNKIMAALRAQKQSAEWRRDGGQYIPYPATWINGGCWEDETAPEQTSGCGEHSYDLNKLLEHATNNIPTIP